MVIFTIKLLKNIKCISVLDIINIDDDDIIGQLRPQRWERV